MKEKYYDLIINKCLNFKKSKILFISYDVINEDFVHDLLNRIDKNIEVYFDRNNIYESKDVLNKLNIDEIDNCKYFDKSIWNIYAKKNANFLMIDSPIPHVMDLVDPKKIAKSQLVKNRTREIFKKMQLNNELTWTIVAAPNKLWADDMFKGKTNAYELLEESIYKVCMVNTLDPVKSWDNYIKSNRLKVDYLNKLNIKELHYTNSLGTNLTIELNKNSIWNDASGDNLVNMPSYEIFTSPNYLKTNGIVYSSRPLIYNGGLIEDFSIEFKDGKAIKCHAKKGKDILKGIIESDNNSCYLGECALVPYNSPISNTKLVFGTTLIDENASCHIALGEGFSECISDGFNKSEKELLKMGINMSKIHVDFMIGTKDINIKAITFDNREIDIFRNGNFYNID